MYWEEDFGWSVSSLSQLMALTHVCNGLSTPLSGLLIDRHPAHLCISGGLLFLAASLALTAVMTTTWQVWLVYGVLCGTAFGLLNLNVFSVAVMQHLPPHRHGLAVGISTSGSTFGQFALVPLFALVTRSWGWRVGYLSLAVLTLALAPPAFWLLRDVSDVSGGEFDNAQKAKQGFYHNGADNGTGNDSDDEVDKGNRDDNDDDEDGGGGDRSSFSRNNFNVSGCITAVESKEQEYSMSLQMVEVRSTSEPTGATLTLNTDIPEESLDEGVKVSSTPAATCHDEESLFTAICIDFANMRRCPQFAALTAAFVLCGITTTGFVEVHLVKLVVHNGFSILTGSLAFSVLSVCNGVSMVCSGYLADRFNRHYLLAAIFFLRGIADFLLLSTSLEQGGLVTLFTFAVLFGVANYSVVPPVVSLVKTYLPGAVGLSMGVLLMFHSAGAAIGAALGGAFFQHFGSYDQVVVLCSGLCFVGAMCCLTMQNCGSGKHEKLFRGETYSHVSVTSNS